MLSSLLSAIHRSIVSALGADRERFVRRIVTCERNEPAFPYLDLLVSLAGQAEIEGMRCMDELHCSIVTVLALAERVEREAAQVAVYVGL